MRQGRLSKPCYATCTQLRHNVPRLTMADVTSDIYPGSCCKFSDFYEVARSKSRRHTNTTKDSKASHGRKGRRHKLKQAQVIKPTANSIYHILEDYNTIYHILQYHIPYTTILDLQQGQDPFHAVLRAPTTWLHVPPCQFRRGERCDSNGFAAREI